MTFRFAICAWLFAALAGCATIYNPATGRTETVLNTSIEVALGQVARAEMGLTSLRVGPVSPGTLTRVQTIGQKIARMSDRRDVRYQFGVVQDKSLNAFALPGGTLYVHSGLVEKATDDELAAVIAHEVGHVAARHAAKHLQADLGFALLAQVASAAGGGPDAARVAQSVYGLLRNGYSRSDELQADRLGIRYAAEAGYNPYGIVTFFEKMLAEEPEDLMDQAAVWQRTHPLASNRIRQAKEEIARLSGQMFCPECGRIEDSAAKFCPRDGTPLKPRRKRS